MFYENTGLARIMIPTSIIETPIASRSILRFFSLHTFIRSGRQTKHNHQQDQDQWENKDEIVQDKIWQSL